MKRKPHRRRETIFSRMVVTLIAVGGIWSCIVNLGIFSWALGTGKSLIEAQSLVFITLIVIQFFKAFSYRSDRLSIFEIGLFANKWLIWAVLVSFAMTIPLIYVPFLQEKFHTFPLGLSDWAIIVLSSATIFIVLEVAKFIIRWREKSLKVTEGIPL